MKISQDNRDAAAGANAERRATVGVAVFVRLVMMACLCRMRIVCTRYLIPAGHGYEIQNIDAYQQGNDFHDHKYNQQSQNE
jgi:hypothetical protein